MADCAEHACSRHWLDRIPWSFLLLAAIFLGLAPFHPEPHLVEKVRMLFQGVLSSPFNIFDLFLHGTPQVLVILKAQRQWRQRPSTETPP